MVRNGDLCGRRRNNRVVCARLTLDCVAGITETPPCGSIRRNGGLYRELSVVRGLRTRQV